MKWKIPVGAGYRPVFRNGDGNYYVGDEEYAYRECKFDPTVENPGSEWDKILKLPYIIELIENNTHGHVFKVPKNDRKIVYIIVLRDELIRVDE